MGKSKHVRERDAALRMSEKTTGMKTCTKCHQVKSISEYYMHRPVIGQYKPACKHCMLARSRQWVKDNHEKDKAARREQHYVRRYGLNSEQRAAMKRAQGGACAICRTAGAKLFVDHNHATGRVRAFLCHNCNIAMGAMKESPKLLRAAIAYLEHHNFQLVTEEAA